MVSLGTGSGTSILVLDSATRIGCDARDRVVICGSHGGRYPGGLLLNAGVRAAAFHAAGVGRDEAGIAALPLFEEFGVPAVAVRSDSARIGRGDDLLARGRVGHLNDRAAALGCRTGMSMAEAATLLDAAPTGGECPHVVGNESRRLLVDAPRPVWALDSASLVRPSDAGAVVVTGSHGELLGDRDTAALTVDAYAAAFNDAGTTACVDRRDRLAALADRGILAVTVAAASARIGDAVSTHDDGVVSRVNAPAYAAGARPGMPLARFVAGLLDRPRPATA